MPRAFSRPVVYAMWAVSEVAAMATDLAEFLGGAIGLSLLFGIPLLAGMIVTGIVTYAVLTIEKHGFRPMELVIGGLIAIIGLCYIVELFIVPVDWMPAAMGTVSPLDFRSGSAFAFGRHHRCDSYAARHLPAFRPHAGADAGP